MGKSQTFNTRLFHTKFRSFKLKCFLFIAIVITVYFIITYKFIEVAMTKNHIENKLQLKNVIMHLDLKGSPPKISYLKTLLPKLQSLGVTGLLMEYEDMFPYQGPLINLSATNCYRIKELKEFVSLAVHVGLDVIPLVQTFGHMEHALKLREFQQLREIPLYPDSICPNQQGSRELIKNMLEQIEIDKRFGTFTPNKKAWHKTCKVLRYMNIECDASCWAEFNDFSLTQIINFHQKISPLKYLHIGADEVYHINKCVQCLRKHHSEMDIYLCHVDTVLSIVKTISPSTTVLIWDDMFRKIPMNKWEDVTFENKKVEPVYWEYRPTFKISHSSMMEYHKKFNNIWIASAFKGADGRIATYPNLTKRFWNHFTWLKSILDYKFGGENNVYEFSGIILTGWSRYSHMDPPCELLPVSIPSLYLNLLLLKKFNYIDPNVEDYDTNDIFNKHLHDDFTGNLHCTERIDMEYFDSTNCYFGGNELFSILKDCDTIITDITNEISNVESDLSTLEFYSKTNNNNMNRVQDNIKWCNDSINNLQYIINKLINNLSYYYYPNFVDEYVNYKFYNSIKTVNRLLKVLENMSEVRSWKKRP